MMYYYFGESLSIEYCFSSCLERSSRLWSAMPGFKRDRNAGPSGLMFRFVSTCFQCFYAVRCFIVLVSMSHQPLVSEDFFEYLFDAS